MPEYIVETTSGKVQGYEREGRIEYLGIPYAEAPVGELRLKRSVPRKPWKGVYDAKEYGSIPIQLDHGVVQGDEDCLTVNIKRPLKGDRLPVFVWIYGGGYNTGGSADSLYAGDAFVEDGILFASFNYRTNVMGFYDFTTYRGCEDLDSNCGLSDQILALNWIHDNVAAFGGDPDRITIGGESAGGASVVTMLACPGARGTFQQAIIESALPNCVMTHQSARENIDLFLEGMHWTEKDLQRLRTDDPRMFLAGNEYVAVKHQYKNPGMFLPGPIQDDLLPERPLDAIKNGCAAGIRVIIGTNRHEGTMFVHPENTGFPNSWTMVAEMLEKNGNADGLAGIVDYYHPAKADPSEAGEDPFIRFATDYAFEMPAVKLADFQKDRNPDIWMYKYELLTKNGLESGLKAGHAFEMPSVFVKRDHPFSHLVFDNEPEALFEEMADQLHGDWVRFIKNGNPNENWPRFTGPASEVRIYDRETRTEKRDRTAMMEAWGDMRFYED